jgi:hypothetical protein
MAGGWVTTHGPESVGVIASAHRVGFVEAWETGIQETRDTPTGYPGADTRPSLPGYAPARHWQARRQDFGNEFATKGFDENELGQLTSSFSI